MIPGVDAAQAKTRAAASRSRWVALKDTEPSKTVCTAASNGAQRDASLRQEMDTLRGDNHGNERRGSRDLDALERRSRVESEQRRGSGIAISPVTSRIKIRYDTIR